MFIVFFNMFNGLFWPCSFRRRLFLQDLCTARGCLSVCSIWKLGCAEVWVAECDKSMHKRDMLHYILLYYILDHIILYHITLYCVTLYYLILCLILHVSYITIFIYTYWQNLYIKWFHMFFARSGAVKKWCYVTMCVTCIIDKAIFRNSCPLTPSLPQSDGRPWWVPVRSCPMSLVFWSVLYSLSTHLFRSHFWMLLIGFNQPTSMSFNEAAYPNHSKLKKIICTWFLHLNHFAETNNYI
jgi:hypothetical protein